MKRKVLSSDEFDLLKELINIAMGLSASELAELFNYFVKLKVPSISIESSEELPETILRNSIFSEDEEIIAVKQKFNNNEIQIGEAYIILNKKTRESVLPLLGLSGDEIESDMISDFLLELSGQLIGSCLSNLLKQFYETSTSYSSPEMVCNDKSLRRFAFQQLESGKFNRGDVLYSKIEFVIDKVNFLSDLIILFDSRSLPNLKLALQKILEESK